MEKASSLNIQHLTLQFFFNSLNATLEQQKELLFPTYLSIYSCFYSSMVMVGTLKASDESEKIKTPSNILCVFFF